MCIVCKKTVQTFFFHFFTFRSSLSEMLRRGYSESITAGKILKAFVGRDLICSRMQADHAVLKCAKLCLTSNKANLPQLGSTFHIQLEVCCRDVKSISKKSLLSPTRARPSILSNILSQSSQVLCVTNHCSLAQYSWLILTAKRTAQPVKGSPCTQM